jgi:two-component system sensor histidine kinase QseC
VADSGPGIPEEEHQAIFERFYRVGRDRHPSGETGCGLGLAIVRRLVELHRGRIGIARSVFETGTAFEVELPMQPPPGRLAARADGAPDVLA